MIDPADPFLATRYAALNDSAMQRKLRRLRPWPVGVVFIERPGMTMAEIRAHFRRMRELGFNCLKQCQVCATTDWRAVYHAALDEGIIPWWYGEAGWEEPTPELLRELGLPEDLTPEALREHPVWQRRQEAVMRARIDRPEPAGQPMVNHETDGVPGTLKRDQYGLAPEARDLFVAWLKARYRTVEALKEAWNFHYPMVQARPWRTWAQVRKEIVDFVTAERQEYRRIVDVLRFRADMHLQMIRRARVAQRKKDRNVPLRTGGEMSLFLPFAARSTDMEGIAAEMAEGGSFYPSIHPGWHFEEADFEFARPIYMQASLATDWFKGGWAATWESTGGPQQLSGGKAPFVPEVRDRVAGFTVNENTIAQLMLSWMAGGFKGFGLWCWNARGFGWEGGEYALTDRHQQPGARAVAAGKIGRAAARLRDELWSARKEPLVGLFQDWESDAFWAAVSLAGRDMYKQWPVRARIGAARALIDANVPWEHVTARNLHAGMAGRYRDIYLPAQLAVDEAVLERLHAFAEEGGRVVLDAPGGWYGYDGRLLSTAEGSAFERLFGVRIDDYQYSRSNHTRWRIDGHELAGFALDLHPTTARVVERFEDGAPSVTENRVGRGTAVILGYEAALGCWKPGDTWLQARLVRHVLGRHRSPYTCRGGIAYRLASPTADHYFLLNDEPVARRLRLDVRGQRYRRWEDPVEGTTVRSTASLAVPPHGARWLRAVK
jgi:beta-galactosidase